MTALTTEYFDDTPSGDSVRIDRSADGIVITYFDPMLRPDGKKSSGREMARFSSQDQLLRIFPAESSRHDKPQFSKIKELQIEVAQMKWSPSSPVGSSERFDFPELSGLPIGFNKIFAYGLGIHINYRMIIREVESETPCTAIRFGSNTCEGIHGDVFHLPMERFQTFVRTVDRHRRRASDVARRINETESYNEIARIQGKPSRQPYPGRIPIIQAITRAITDNTPLDDGERTALVERMSAELRTVAEKSSKPLGKLREDLDLVALDVLIERFTLELKKSSSLESTWQEFFKDNKFALSQLFATPIVYFDEQIDLRQPTTKNRGRRVADYVMLNAMTRSIVVVEIKTPAQSLIEGRPYRGRDGAEVYAPHADLTRAIAQLQGQLESGASDFLEMARRDGNSFESSGIRGALIIGKLDGLTTEQMSSFERFRAGLHQITILAFDEVRDRLEFLRAMLQEHAGTSSGGDEE